MLIRVTLAALAVCGLAGAAGPSCSAVAGWSQQGDARTFAADNLFEYMDGNAEGYLIYGFQNMRGVTCKKDGVTLVIDLSDFGDADSSFGMFSANRDPRQPEAKVGMSAQIVPAARPPGERKILPGDRGRSRRAITRRCCGNGPSRSRSPSRAAPSLPQRCPGFPPAQRQSLRLVPESVLGIRILKRGYAAQYEFGKAFVITDEAAAGGHGKAAGAVR